MIDLSRQGTRKSKCGWWLAASLTLLAAQGPAHADTVVTNSTQQALEYALSQGGDVRFTNDCSVTLSRTLVVTNQATLNSTGKQVVLTASTNFSLMRVAADVTFSANKIHFRGGTAPVGGALVIDDGAVVRLTNCSFTNNVAAGSDGDDGEDGDDGVNAGKNGTGGTDATPGYGGAIYNLGSLTCSNVVFSGNQAIGGSGGNGGNGGAGNYTGGDGGKGGKGYPGCGGAIHNLGSLSVQNCYFVTNSVSGGDGGSPGEGGDGAFAGWPGIGGSSGAGYGGAICSSNALEVEGSTFAGNRAQGGSPGAGGTEGGGSGTDGLRGSDGNGGAIWSTELAALTNCTFYANTAQGGNGGDGGPGSYSGGNGGNGGHGQGGSLANAATLLLVNCTLAGGSATGGTNGVAGEGGFAGVDGTPGKSRGGNLANVAGTLWLKNSILGTATSGGSAYGTISDGGNNISADNSIKLPASWTGLDPKLGSLTTNGGLTLTMLPQPGSPAANAGNNQNAPLMDQRGSIRPGTGSTNVDIGAVEGIGPTITTQPSSQQRTNGQTASFTVAASGDGPLLYRWQLYGTNLPSATNATLVITNLATPNFGPYQVIVSNAFASTTSQTANLTLGAWALTQPQMVSPSFQASQFSFQWLSQAAQSYRVLYNDSLSGTNWTEITNLIGTGSWLTNVQPVTNVSSRFYRLVSP